ncbi:MAG: DegT/DnrJ/EryC1/StrS family aminotransferase [Parabacteroides sp.]|nr:DegT/DnrJ/EryC1/StrS family aminotransferase [Parabacteroides sp.]
MSNKAMGSSYNGKACGSFGKFGVYSYNGNKIITTSGGGMLLSDDKEALDKALSWATQARDPAARRAVFERYQEALGDVSGVGFMPEAPYGRCNRWLTVMSLNPDIIFVKPMDIINALAEENIESRPVWKPMHLQPLFAGCKYFTHEEGESVSDKLFSTGVCLPSGSSLTEEEQQRVIRVVRGKVLGG